MLWGVWHALLVQGHRLISPYLARWRGRSLAVITQAGTGTMVSNTVDLDRERASFTENTVKYEATLRFINGNVRTMLDAMKSHNQG